MPTGTVWPLANKITDGKLAEILLEARERKVSAEAIAQDLFATYEIRITGETIRVWLKALEEEKAQ